MAKGNRGGKRGSSSSDKSMKGLDYFKEQGLVGVFGVGSDFSKMNKSLVDKTLNGIYDTVNEFGIDMKQARVSVFSRNSGVDSDSEVEKVSSNFKNEISFEKSLYSGNMKDFKRDEFYIDSSARGLGTHVGGRIVVNEACMEYNKTHPIRNIKDFNNRMSKEFPSVVISEAKNNVGKLTNIGNHSTKKGRIYLEQAVSDYMINGSNANKSSLAIVDVLKKYLKR